jgi:hypothetical protein
MMKRTHRSLCWLLAALLGFGVLTGVATPLTHGATGSHAHLLADDNPPGLK